MSLELLEDLEAEEKPEKEGSPLLRLLLVCLAITLLAGGAGFGVGATVLSPVGGTAAAVVAPAPEGAAADAPGGAADAPGAGAASAKSDRVSAAVPARRSTLPSRLTVVDIAPITTNLLDPEDVWIRMELALAYDGPADDAISEEIHQDILAYVHTMKLYNLRGGSGFQHLLEDLNERAAIRSGGRVRRVLVRSFILE
ncbi:flagellar basal body-associated FliL family protein [Oricola thermophila]|uniref:Flagellar protein FliL n=1 Tax=Oricola thermophila TaxID=2742145 RepID=A0A6N1VKA6_9HYPH|nr:flagellar basal body-associated FliL family protein [Oricola thermophila]QKV19639.1 flagellar basal body-associated FliL family protein [Oricola thermophila]